MFCCTQYRNLLWAEWRWAINELESDYIIVMLGLGSLPLSMTSFSLSEDDLRKIHNNFSICGILRINSQERLLLHGHM